MYTLLNFAKGDRTVFITAGHFLSGEQKVYWG